MSLLWIDVLSARFCLFVSEEVQFALYEQTLMQRSTELSLHSNTGTQSRRLVRRKDAS